MPLETAMSERMKAHMHDPIPIRTYMFRLIFESPGTEIALMRQAAQLSRRSSRIVFATVIIDGVGYRTETYSLSRHLPAMHIFPILAVKPDRSKNPHADKTLLELESYKSGMEFQGPWSYLTVWGFLQESGAAEPKPRGGSTDFDTRSTPDLPWIDPT